MGQVSTPASPGPMAWKWTYQLTGAVDIVEVGGDFWAFGVVCRGCNRGSLCLFRSYSALHQVGGARSRSAKNMRCVYCHNQDNGGPIW
jgi:hypothetical protein